MRRVLVPLVAVFAALAGCERHELSSGPPPPSETAVQGNRAPAPISFTPASGTGRSGTFTIRFADPDGRADLHWGQVIFNDDVSGTTACYLHLQAGALHLMNDAANAILGPMQPGGRGALENSQCRIDAAGVSVSNKDDAVTLRVSIEFKSALRGSQIIRVRAADRSGHTLEWLPAGNWEIR
ncbi:MAG TPA: hypothetical protein VGQ36_09240 [Thermoanaerobaculia bacterium]|nr:hypothetical protein [Thermoanaerobaculia bacterium]